MKSSKLAYFGALPAFKKPLPVGQLYFPSVERYELALRGIFERQYYNNNGPLNREFENKLQNFFGVKHVICVSNATFGLMMVADALGLFGKVILPAFTFIASAQAVSWAGLKPVFCDVNLETHQIDFENLEYLVDKDVSAIMGINLWGGSCKPDGLEKLARKYGIKLYFDSAHAFGCQVGQKKIGCFGEAEVFSFHATKILSSAEGGCICTNDDELALKLRSICPGYGLDKVATVKRVANARMSEAQAAIGLMSLEDFCDNRNHNLNLYKKYDERIREISGLALVSPSGVDFSNYQYLVCMINEKEFGISRDLLIEVLAAENVIARRYFYPGLHRTLPYCNENPKYLNSLPNTDTLCQFCFQLPIGALVSEQDIDQICDILVFAQHESVKINFRHYEK